ncbi:MAG: hypothetical protein KGJ77_00960 [Acidobacteriota bacterium]|nr:hypothetical protein [Acidobacteriota bacterium]
MARDEHSIVRRQVGRQDDRAWIGSLVCSCGWTTETGPERARDLVAGTLAMAWTAHHPSDEPGR